MHTQITQENQPYAAPENAAELAYSIDIVNLSKRFRRRTVGRGYTTLKSSLVSTIFNRAATTRYTVAIEDLTIRIPRGASVGVIGRNGSGKSTLLKLITGIYKPDTGKININGRVAALIELGAGFHPDFSGRENLFLGGIMHGMTRAQISERFNEIVGFAGLESVIDDPLRTYSSGMFMRLGFSLAVHVKPDVLLIDEVLAVGDAAFVAQCKERLKQLRREGTTLLLVSHDLDAIERWCDEAVWLHSGKVMDRGEPRRVVDHYRQFVERGEELLLEEARDRKREHEPIAGDMADESNQELPVARWGSREIEISQARLLDGNSREHALYHPEDALTIEIDYIVREHGLAPVFGVAIHRSDGLAVFGTNTDIERVAVPALQDRGKIRFIVERLGLLEGNYTVDVAVHRTDGYPYDYHRGIAAFAVRPLLGQIGVVVPAHRWEFDVSQPN